MFTKINVIGIIKAHLRTLRSIRTGNRTFGDLFTFLIVPFIITAIFIYKKILLDPSTISILITSLAIFAGFMFNLIAIVFGFMDKIQNNIKGQDDEELKKIIVRELHSNISYNILVSIVSIICLITCLFATNSMIKVAFMSISYFLLITFVLTMMMILNRVHILMKKEFN